jgi:hypothetical protein
MRIDRRAFLGLGAAGLLATAAPAGAAGWEIYINARFGYRIEYPAWLFGPLEEAENGDGAILAGDDGARLLVFGAINALGQSPAEIAEGLAADGDVAETTYRRVTDDWIVVSGFLADPSGGRGPIFYERIAFGLGGEAMSGFRLEYPETARPSFDPVIGKLGQSLTPPRRY